MKKNIIFSGAGISIESGLKTFRDNYALWENYNFMDLTTPEDWAKDPELVLYPYNLKRKQIVDSQPNNAYTSLIKLEIKYNTQIITQNIEVLHERAVFLKHPTLTEWILKERSTTDNNTFIIKGSESNIGNNDHQLRPVVV